MNSKKILILAGGSSNEKEISKRSGLNLYQAFKDGDFNVDILDPVSEEFSFDCLKQYDLVYPILHGTKGEDGCIQGVLESLDIPYVGCGVMASAITMDKAITKKFFQSMNIPCAEGFVTLNKNLDNIIQNIETIGFPVFVKPVNEGSSVGSLIIHNKEEAYTLLPEHLKKFPNSLVEQFLVGREMTVGIIEQKGEIIVLPVLELKPKAEFYNFETKYTVGMTEFVLPAPIEQSTLTVIHNQVSQIFKELQLHDCVRVDFILTQNGPVYLEVNTAPGMTDTSDIPAMLKSAKINMTDFIKHIINNVQERFSC